MVTKDKEQLANKVLEVRSLDTGYGDTSIVFGADVDVFGGKITTIIGPNGAGKSTLLKAIFGLLPVKNTPKASVIFNSQNTTNKRPTEMVKLGAGFTPQTSNVFVELSVKENLEMGGFTLKNNLSKRVNEVISNFVELKERPNLKAKHLSGGQRQMLALARTLMLKPSLILLDEPTAALSPLAASRVFEQIKNITNFGVGILMVEQNAVMALGISDYGCLMVDGKTVNSGTAKSFLENKDMGKMFLGAV